MVREEVRVRTAREETADYQGQGGERQKLRARMVREEEITRARAAREVSQGQNGERRSGSYQGQGGERRGAGPER